jgi:hypothetical protein
VIFLPVLAFPTKARFLGRAFPFPQNLIDLRPPGYPAITFLSALFWNFRRLRERPRGWSIVNSPENRIQVLSLHWRRSRTRRNVQPFIYEG